MKFLRAHADILRTAVLMTGVSVAASITMTYVGVWATYGLESGILVPIETILRNSLIIGFVIPLLIAPTVAWKLLVILRDLKVARAELQKLSDTDPLTGLLNRRGFLTGAKQMASRARGPVSVLLCDIDRFKSINDRFGHDMGDKAIRHVADILRLGLEETGAVVARHGGEEFAILLSDKGLGAALAIAEALRASCDACPLEADGRIVTTTISVGVAVEAGGPADIDGLLSRADGALYRAKESGRNRVCPATPYLPESATRHAA